MVLLRPQSCNSGVTSYKWGPEASSLGVSDTCTTATVHPTLLMDRWETGAVAGGEHEGVTKGLMVQCGVVVRALEVVMWGWNRRKGAIWDCWCERRL